MEKTLESSSLCICRPWGEEQSSVLWEWLIEDCSKKGNGSSSEQVIRPYTSSAFINEDAVGRFSCVVSAYAGSQSIDCSSQTSSSSYWDGISFRAFDGIQVWEYQSLLYRGQYLWVQWRREWRTGGGPGSPGYLRHTPLHKSCTEFSYGTHLDHQQASLLEGPTRDVQW